MYDVDFLMWLHKFLKENRNISESHNLMSKLRCMAMEMDPLTETKSEIEMANGFEALRDKRGALQGVRRLANRQDKAIERKVTFINSKKE